MVELIANIGIGSEVAQNDFDSMPIFREMQEETDSYGNVFIRIPKFYIRKDVSGSKYEVLISKEKLPGFYLPALFWDFEKEKELPYFLYGKYKASLSDDGLRLESKPGKKPLVSRNIVQFRDLAKANGDGYQINDIHGIDVLQTLFRVEFKTMHSQSIHPGFTSGNTESATTGGTDGLVASSGAMGTGGGYQFSYRGIEDPWGNVYEFIDGININEHRAWVCRDAEQYVSNVFASPYEQLGYINHNADGYVTEMGFDGNLPFAEFPTAVGGGAATYYADYYYRAEEQRIALFGGDWSFGANAGLSFWLLIEGSSGAGSIAGARLIRKPL